VGQEGIGSGMAPAILADAQLERKPGRIAAAAGRTRSLRRRG